MGYLTNAIKALFTRNTTNAASVSGARIPIVEQNGNPIGNDSMANLASVLGVPLGFTNYGVVENINFRTYHKDDFVLAVVTGSNLQDAPDGEAEGMWLYINIPIGTSSDTYYGSVSFAFKWGEGSLYTRTRELNNVWEVWKKYAYV